MAAGLLSLGLKRGDRVGIWGSNSYEWFLTQWGAARAGMILVYILINLYPNSTLIRYRNKGERQSCISSE